MMSFVQSGSETKMYRISSDNKLDGTYGGYANSRYLYGYPKLYTKYSKPSKLKVPTKSKASSLRKTL